MTMKMFLSYEVVSEALITVILLATISDSMTLTLFNHTLELSGLKGGVSGLAFVTLMALCWMFVVIVVFISYLAWHEHHNQNDR